MASRHIDFLVGDLVSSLRGNSKYVDRSFHYVRPRGYFCAEIFPRLCLFYIAVELILTVTRLEIQY